MPEKYLKDILSFILLLCLTSSCNSSKKLIYFEDLKQSPETQTEISNTLAPKIQPNDILGITVSSLNPESNTLFNNGTLITPGNGNNSEGSSRANEGYLVDEKGFINFPVVGKVGLAGLTRAEATEKMTVEITKYVKNPIVNIRFLNFKITVLGEVNQPASYTTLTERVNIVEALGLAGDMTAFGKRDNILIIRERNGLRTTARINISTKDALNSPYYYLQQNDIVYVEPVNARAAQVNNTRNDINFGLSLLSFLGIIFAFIN